jgi:hypothetical protein
MKKTSQVVGSAMQKRASRAVKQNKKTSGPRQGLAKSTRPQAQDGPVNPELKRLLTPPSVFERLVDYRPDLLNLKDPRHAAEYLDQALASGDTDTLKLAVRDFVEAMKPASRRGKVMRRL